MEYGENWWIVVSYREYVGIWICRHEICALLCSLLLLDASGSYSVGPLTCQRRRLVTRLPFITRKLRKNLFLWYRLFRKQLIPYYPSWMCQHCGKQTGSSTQRSTWYRFLELNHIRWWHSRQSRLFLSTRWWYNAHSGFLFENWRCHCKCLCCSSYKRSKIWRLLRFLLHCKWTDWCNNRTANIIWWLYLKQEHIIWSFQERIDTR